jgi:short-subunit dehydrogenase
MKKALFFLITLFLITGCETKVAGVLHQSDTQITVMKNTQRGQIIVADYLEKEYKVYRVSKSDGIDLSDIKSLEKLEFIKDKNIKILVNAAGIGIFKPHEEIKVEEITNLK